MTSFWKVRTLLDNYSHFVAIGTVGSCWIAYFLGRSSVDEFYRYSNTYTYAGEEMKPSSRLRNIFNKVKTDCHLGEKDDVNLFLTNESTYVGHLHSWFRGPPSIGIPFFCNFSKLEEMPEQEVILSSIPLLRGASDTPVGKKLKGMLFFSDDELCFLIARQLHYVQSYRDLVRMTTASVAGILSYGSAWLFNRIRRMQKPLKRYGIYACISSIYIFIYYQVVNNYQGRLDFSVDAAAARLGEEYSRGGVQFYENNLQRNIVIRHLSGSKGPKRFSPAGNELSPINAYHGSQKRLVHLKAALAKKKKDPGSCMT